MPTFAWFERHRAYAALFIRLAVGTRLISGTQDNVFSAARMQEFAHFLAANGTPFPLVAAFVSVYAQFICGALFILGLWTRPAAVVMIVNFLAALVIAHRDTPFEVTWPALMMLAAALFFLFNGAGRPSVDAILGDGERRQAREQSVVEVPRRAETGEAPGDPGARRENIGNM